MKLVGSLCILAGGALAWQRQHRERRRRRDTLSDLIHALGRMSEEIRMARTAMPSLLTQLAADCRGDAATLFCRTAQAARRGEPLEAAWRHEAASLPLEAREIEVLQGLSLHGDEVDICKGVSLVISCLTKALEDWDRARPEAERRAAALCFSGAALLVILLI